MALAAIVLVPVIGSLAGLLIGSRNARMGVLVLASLLHLALVSGLWVRETPAGLGPIALMDPLGQLVLTVVSAVFLATSIYLVQYRHLTPPRTTRTFLVPLLLLSLAAMSAVCMARHLALLWVSSGGLTLSVAPLVFLQRGRRSLEAAWKYLMLSCVGVAIALLGIFLVAIAANAQPARESAASPLQLDELLLRAHAGRMDVAWLRAGFICMLVGFGTKVGLAPMHTWKPDTYAEAPVPVAALMATALANCALLCVLRGYQVCVAAGEGEFAGRLLLVLGLTSIGVAAAFMAFQTDARRLLAYSGVEHVGVIALGVGIGGRACFGALLHLVGHSLAKLVLFFAVGNVAYAYRTRSILDITGVLRRMPLSGVLLVCGFTATVGFPPFSIFVSELTIVAAAVSARQNLVAVLALALLSLAFIGVIANALAMAHGDDPRGGDAPPERESRLLVVPGYVLLVLLAAIGVHLPSALGDALIRAAAVLGG